jgi:hypothetical protein
VGSVGDSLPGIKSSSRRAHAPKDNRQSMSRARQIILCAGIFKTLVGASGFRDSFGLIMRATRPDWPRPAIDERSGQPGAFPGARPRGATYGVIDNDREKSAADQHYRTNDYAFGVKKPRRTQITQRPYSSSVRGMVPACPARCLRWSPNVQMPAPSGTRIGAVSSAVRGVEALFPLLLTASLRSTSLPSLRNVRTEFAYVNRTHCGHAPAV